MKEVPKQKPSFSATEVGRSAASPPLPRFEALVGEKLMVVSIAAAKRAQKRAIEMEPSGVLQRNRRPPVGRLLLRPALSGSSPSHIEVRS